MIIYPTKTDNPRQNVQLNRVIELKQAGKKYPYLNKGSKVINPGFDDFWSLKDVSFDVYQGEILGIIGRNGSGKTTLLNIMAGVLSCTEGKVFLKGKALGLFNLGIGFQDELTGRENIFLNAALLGAEKEELDSKLDKIIEFSELKDFINMPLGSYSQGMRLRLGFSVIVHLDCDILLIDEILAVGDAPFQSKCFERLMDLKRQGKTLVITNQSMELIERLCDKVALLDHGHLFFCGDVPEGINKYRILLNSEQFFVGPVLKNTNLVENTKKWAEDIAEWGQKLGTKEVVIESVEFINKYGIKCNKIRTMDPLKIRVNFNVRNRIKDIHFGVAIFRKDGVYCYGPNTAFDGYNITGIKPGKGYFELNYKQIFLAPGEYKVSIAIWDKNETLAFNYHNGYYPLLIEGYSNEKNWLINMPFKLSPSNNLKNILSKGKKRFFPDLTEGLNRETEDAKAMSIKLLNHLGQEKDVFITNEPVSIVVNFDSFKKLNNKSYFCLGIFCDGGIYCQGITALLSKNNKLKISFPRFSLLPGEYSISAAIWDAPAKAFLRYCRNTSPFKMIFNREDHGIIHLEHNWLWRQ